MPQELAFVTTDGSAKIQAAERQTIRRHCMRQKNKQPGSRRSRREAARAAAEHARKSQGKGNKKEQPSSAQAASVAVGGGDASRSVGLSANRPLQLPNGQGTIPSPPSDWALFPLPDTLDVPAQKLMHQYFLHNPIRDALYPFKHFGIRVDFDDTSISCFQALCSDQLFLRAALLLGSASDDLLARRPLSNLTRWHLRRTLPLLNDLLSAAHANKSDLTVYVIGILAAIAILFGDYDAAQMHAAGLAEVIRLRGGFMNMSYSPVVQFSIDRLNFSSSLVTKLWMPVYDSSVWKAPVFPADIKKLYQSTNMVCVHGVVDAGLADLFRQLQYTTLLFNKHYYDRTPMEGKLGRQCLGFVHSGLTALESRVEHALSRCLCLGMMVFLAATFRLPGWYGQHYCKPLVHQLRLSYAAAKSSAAGVERTIDIWLILVFLMSTDDREDPYIYESWKCAEASSLGWSEIRGQLKQVLWIDTFHDDLGRRAYDALVARDEA